MLSAHPVVLARPVERYEALCLPHGDDGPGDSAGRQRLEDVAYTLCVSTGTRDVAAALNAARHRLPGARVGDDSVLTGAPRPAVTATP